MPLHCHLTQVQAKALLDYLKNRPLFRNVCEEIEHQLGSSSQDWTVEEAAPPSIQRLFRALSREVFTEKMSPVGHPTKKRFYGEELTIHTYSMDVDDHIATVKIADLPSIFFRSEQEDTPETEPDQEDPGRGSYPWKGIQEIPEGHSAYAWYATLDLSPPDVGLVATLARKMTRILHADFALRLSAKIMYKKSKYSVHPDTEIPTAISEGLFSTGATPEEVHRKLKEAFGRGAFGIQSILPTTPVRSPHKTPIRKEDTLSDLLNKLIS